MTDDVAFVCVNVGPRYGMEYVSILADMVRRNCSTMKRQAAFFCITDRPDELPTGVELIAADPALPGYWQKVRLFSPEMPWEDGQRVVYFDLDVVITGRLEDLVERKGIIRDWHWPMFNSSVMVWDHGEHRAVWERFTPDVMTRRPAADISALLPAGAVNAGDQHWITLCEPEWATFPPEWFRSYRNSQDWPPVGCKAVIFHGEPKPDAIIEGWVPDVWRSGGFTSLPEMDGANASFDDIIANVKINAARDLPWFDGRLGDWKKGSVVLVGGAPSMRDCITDIRWHQHRGAKIVSVNNAWRVLVENGVTPHAHVMLDARPENAAFIEGAPKSTRYFLASQVHPSVFEALAEHDIVVWHNGVGQNDEMRAALQPWWDDGPNQRPILLVPGGGTVGLRALWLLAFSGYDRIHVYGMDSSMRGTEHHAYAQPLNDGEHLIEVAMREKRYVCSLWMARQASEFVTAWHDLKREGVRLFVHGEGLIPDIAKNLRDEERVKA